MADQESPLTRVIALICRHFSSNEEADKIPETAIQKALAILAIGLDIEMIPDIPLIHTKLGWWIPDLQSYCSKYYSISTSKTGGRKALHFVPDIESIQQDLRRDPFMELAAPRYIKPLSIFYRDQTNGIENLLFMSLFLSRDGGLFDLGDGLRNALKEVNRYLFTKKSRNNSRNTFNEYINGVRYKLDLLKRSKDFISKFDGIVETNGLKTDDETNLVLSIVNPLDSSSSDVVNILTLIEWVSDKVIEMGELAYSIVDRKIVNQPSLFASAGADYITLKDPIPSPIKAN